MFIVNIKIYVLIVWEKKMFVYIFFPNLDFFPCILKKEKKIVYKRKKVYSN